jgi:hypothetical protein
MVPYQHDDYFVSEIEGSGLTFQQLPSPSESVVEVS